MTLLTLMLALSLAMSLAHAASTTQSISWFPCPPSTSITNATDAGTPLTCGSLTVPLDYTLPNSLKTLSLQLTKVAATIQPSRGSILLNPGGPGSVGANIFVQGPAEALLRLTGGAFDLIAFNPRGTGQTLPFSCYTSEADREAAQLLTPTSLGGSDTAIGQVWAANGALAQLCYENAGRVGELIGTAFTARDMFQTVDALGEDGLLRYLGFSYGTVLGATAAALFPERIDRMVLDGNVGLHDYYSGTSLNTLRQDDETLSGFFAGCLESPHLCPLAANGSTATELYNKTYNLLQTLKYHPNPAPQALPNAQVIDYDNFQSFLQSMLYFPTRWPSAAAALDALFRGNITGYLLNAGPATTTPGSSLPDPDASRPEAGYGIQCGDTTLRSTKWTHLVPLIHKIEASSRFLGPVGPPVPTLLCPQWKFQAKEIYAGGFKDIRTRYPILFIGNSVDPVTPLANAYESSAGFPGSVVLENDGYGHTSAAAPSLCTARHVISYCLNGSLPAPDTVCKHSYKVFDTPSSYLDLLGAAAKV